VVPSPMTESVRSILSFTLFHVDLPGASPSHGACSQGPALIAVAFASGRSPRPDNAGHRLRKDRRNAHYKLETTCKPQRCRRPSTAPSMRSGHWRRHGVSAIRSARARKTIPPSAKNRSGMSRWMPPGKQWVSLEQAGARDSHQTRSASNGLDLCVVNPNLPQTASPRQSHRHGRQGSGAASSR